MFAIDPSWFILIAAPFVGSFLGVVIDRTPHGASVARPPSSCPDCGTRLGVLDLIPMISWLVLRARCRHCKQAIPVFYPLIELGALAVAGWAFTAATGVEMVLLAILGWLLLALSVIDHRHHILPNGLVALVFLTGAAALALPSSGAPLPHVVGALAGFALMAGLAGLYRRLRGIEGLGWGDAKFVAAAGLWVGWQGLPSLLLIASSSALLVALAGILLGKKLTATTRIAFGPYLCFATWLVQLYGPIGF